MTKLYTFEATVKHDGSWYHIGSHYQLTEEQASAMKSACRPYGELPKPRGPTAAEIRKARREHCAAVETAKTKPDASAHDERLARRRRLAEVEAERVRISNAESAARRDTRRILDAMSMPLHREDESFYEYTEEVADNG